MIPEHIEIENFGCIPFVSINLIPSQGKTTGIVGPNGTGKSTVFSDAPLWALFGLSRGDSDSCIRKSNMDSESNEKGLSARVVFVFSHNGYRWKVVRARAFKGKTTLSLFRMEGALWNDVSGRSVRDTEKIICDLLRMNGSTFRATSMMMQGDSAAFCAATPSVRRSVLSSLCGLDIYSDLLVKVRAMKKKSEDTDKLVLEAQGLEMAEENKKGLEDRREHAALTDKKLVEEEESCISLQKTLAEELRVLRSEKERFDMDEARLHEEEKALEENKRKLEGVAVHGKRIAESVAAMEHEKSQLVSERERLLSETALLTQKLESVADKTNEMERINKSIKSLTLDISSRKKTLEEYDVRMKQLQQIKAESEQSKGKRTLLEDTLSKLHERYPSGTGEIDSQLRCVQQEIEQNTSSIRELDREATILKSSIAELERQEELLDNAECPNKDIALRSPCRFLRHAAEARQKLPNERKKLKTVVTKLESATHTLEENKQMEERLRSDHAEWLSSETRLLKLKAFDQELLELGRIETSVTELKGQIQAKCEEYERLESEKKRLSEVLSDVEAIRKTLFEAQGALQRITDSATTLDKKLSCENETLLSARVQYGAVRQSVESSEGQVLTLRHRVEDYKKSCDAEKYHQKESELQKVELRVREISRERARLQNEIGQISSALETVEKNVLRYVDITKELQQMNEDALLYGDLEEAFGPDGIPHDVFESIVPELSERANHILSELTDGRMSVEIQTERELKDGRSVPGLEIVVSDYDGERPYETFSGGERFRIDLSIRMALAEYLASRTGGKIEWVTLDEGFGSQDDKHLALVLESLDKLSNHYGSLFVITHVKDAVRYFDRTIDLEEVLKETKRKSV